MPVNPSYVASDGSGNTCTSIAPCALSYANSNAAAGDTVYLRGGTYTMGSANGIAPSNSGSDGNYITFVNYTGETPNLHWETGNNSYSIDINNKSYIKIDGITFTQAFRGDIVNGSNHIEVARCIFTADVLTQASPHDPTYQLSIYGGSDPMPTHIWIHHCTFEYTPPWTDCTEGYNTVWIGREGNDNNGIVEYVTYENNVTTRGGHAAISTAARYSVIKNNVAHNEPWRTASQTGCAWPNTGGVYSNSAYDGKYGHRTLNTYGSDCTRTPGTCYITETFDLYEGNRLGHAGANAGNDGANNIELTSKKNILRYNAVYNAMNNGMLIKSGGDSAGNNNRIYNNTFYHNGYGYSGTAPGSGFPSGYESMTGIAIYSTTSDNVIKNNLFYGNATPTNGSTYPDVQRRVGGDPAPYATLTNNWFTTTGNPTFVNTDVTNTSSTTLPDVNLQSSSAAIDGGVSLTTTVGADTSTNLVVVDSLYFQDGKWGADMARGVTHFADWIAVGTISNVAQITDVSYNSNTITLDRVLTWANGASVWLYKKSDGVQILKGTAPDYGANEYDASATYTITGSAPTCSSISCASPITSGDGGTCTIVPGAGKGVSSVSGSTCLGSGTTTWTFTGIVADCTVTAVCKGLDAWGTANNGPNRKLGGGLF